MKGRWVPRANSYKLWSFHREEDVARVITGTALKLPFELRHTRTLAWDPSDNNFHLSFLLRGCSKSDTATLTDTLGRCTSSEDLSGTSFHFLWPGLTWLLLVIFCEYSMDFLLHVKCKKKNAKISNGDTRIVRISKEVKKYNLDNFG